MREAHIFPLRSHAHLQAIKVGTSALWEGSACLIVFYRLQDAYC